MHSLQVHASAWAFIRTGLVQDIARLNDVKGTNIRNVGRSENVVTVNVSLQRYTFILFNSHRLDSHPFQAKRGYVTTCQHLATNPQAQAQGGQIKGCQKSKYFNFGKGQLVNPQFSSTFTIFDLIIAANHQAFVNLGQSQRSQMSQVKGVNMNQKRVSA